MTEETNAVTKKLTFRFGERDFQIKLKFPTEKTRKASSTLEASISFFNFLKELKIVDNSEKIQKWANSGDTEFIFTPSDKVTSLKIRKKAYNLGIPVIPGEVYRRNQEESYQKAIYK